MTSMYLCLAKASLLLVFGLKIGCEHLRQSIPNQNLAAEARYLSQTPEHVTNVDFTGHYRQVASHNMDPLLNRIGFSYIIRLMAMYAEPDYVISYNQSDGRHTLQTITSGTRRAITFKSGEEIREKRYDGSVVSTVVVIRGNRWYQIQATKPRVLIVRDFDASGAGITVRWLADDVVAVQRFQKEFFQ